MNNDEVTTAIALRADRRFILVAMALLIVVAGGSVAGALGYLGDDPSVWIWLARNLWPAGLVLSGLGIARLSRLLVSGVVLVVDAQHLVLRSEIFRFTDRVINRRSVISGRVMQARYGPTVVLGLSDGNTVRISTRLLRPGVDLVSTLRIVWPDVSWL